MILIISKKADEEILKRVAEDLKGYVKLVVDLKRRILAAGGLKHSDAEQLLLDDGSKQQDLWGGGIDLETGLIDFDSMINLRPGQGNPSREVLLVPIRETMQKIIHELLISK